MASTTEQAVKRLEAALQSLEHAVEQRLSLSGDSDALAEEVQMLSADRARLVETLDQAQAWVARLETVNRDVSRRLDGAIEAIRAVLEADEASS